MRKSSTGPQPLQSERYIDGRTSRQETRDEQF